MSVGAVDAATNATRAALEGMREIGRMAANMVAPAVGRTVRTAGDATRSAMGARAKPKKQTKTTKRAKKRRAA